LNLAHAVAYDAAGWVVIPIIPGTKKALVKWKHITEPDAERTSEYWRHRPDASIGVLCGPSGFLVVDVDDDEGLAYCPKLPPTANVTTGRGTHHIYLDESLGRLRNTTGRLPIRGVWVDTPGIDLRASGGLFVAPPSLHKSGAEYTWNDKTAAIVPAPPWLRPVVERPHTPAPVGAGVDCSNQIAAILKVARVASKGHRNASLNWAAWRIGELVSQGQISRSVAFDGLAQAARTAGLGDSEARATINSGLDFGETKAT
jgi:hypothetical protein